MSELPSAVGMAPDLEACSREPIHIPGAIQAHGILLALRPEDGSIVQVSRNTETLLGLSPSTLLGQKIDAFFPPEFCATLRAIAAEQPEGNVHASVLGTVTWQGRAWEATAHRHDGVVILELEIPPPQTELPSAAHYRLLETALAAMRAAADLPALCDRAAETVAALTGFERVMVYRFAADWHGEVIGEALRGDVESYRGLHFPASDIPEQARALYAKNRLRLIPQVDYTPVALEPALNPLTGRPLDLSFASLRSVSPVHLEYLRNMQVGASMSISLLLDGRLWGLIACHHRAARHLGPTTRAACELFGGIVAAEIASAQEARRLTEFAQAKTIQTRFFDVLSQEQNFLEALVKYTPQLLEFIAADGAAIWVSEQLTLLGATPEREDVLALIRWLETQQLEPLLETDRLGEIFPPAASFQKIASGLLAVKLSLVEPHFVLWFRPEVVTTVNWAGNPEKPVESGARLHPRKSFAAWQQIVAGRSQPWRETDLEAARELRDAINALVLRRTERLINLNAELERKNSDLNSFAYIAAHDVKEPIRGIYNYSRFLREDCGEQIGTEGLRYLDTITMLAARTEQLLDALQNYSRIGRIDLHPQETDLEQLLDEVLQILASRVQETGMRVRRPRPLPTVNCDPVLLREVFLNLLTNALKYTPKPDKFVELGWLDATTETPRRRGPIFYVRDNGIGIRERHFDAVFQILRRLHSRDEFGGGSGAGLAIVKSIVERHGGQIWLESVFGEGTTFFFTLQ